MIQIERAVADASALLALVGALPVEPPNVGVLYAPDAALVEVVTVLRSFHDGRSADILGDIGVVGLIVAEWIPTTVMTTGFAELVIGNPDEQPSDLAALVTARTLGIPLVTGVRRMSQIDPAVTVVLLART